MIDHEKYMAIALDQARLARDEGEVPVGCVIVKDGEIIAKAHNRRENGHSALLHAESIAIHKAGQIAGDWRMDGCRLYVTLEPCLMCAGAIANSRVSEVFFGAKDKIAGACGSILNVFEEGFGNHPKLIGGIMEKECTEILQNFFREKRKK